jgi:PAS domain S-box-containing protein
MHSVRSQFRIAPVIAASAVGITVSWLMRSPLGLLVPMAALFLFARGRAVLLLHAASAIGLVGSLLVAAIYAGATRDLAGAWASFFALALCIGAIVAADVSASPDAETTRAAALNTIHEATSPHTTARATFGGRTAADVPSSLSLIHPGDRLAAAHAAARAFWTGVPQVTRHRRLQADGHYRWTETRSEPGYSVSVDIDDLVTEREPLTTPASNPSDEREVEAIRSARVIESLFGNGWAFDAAGRWIYLHPFAQNSLGVTLEDLNASLNEGHTAWKRLLHPDDYDRIAAAWRHCLQTGDHFNVEFRFRRATGMYVWARTAARPSHDSQGRITGWFGIALDVDVYKKTVAALRDRERELSHLVDMVPSHIWRLAPDGEPIFFNKRMVDFLGFAVTDTNKPGMSRLTALVESAVHPDDAAQLNDTLRHCLITGDSFDLRHRLRRADGVYRWMSSRAEPMRDQSGRILQWYGLCHDIDDQRHAEEALRQSARQLQQLVDAVPATIWCTTRDGTPTYRNKRHTEVTGVALEDLTAPDGSSSPLAIIAHPDDRAAAQQVRARAFETGSTYVVRYRQIRRDGTYRWTESRAEPLRDESGEILQWYGVSVDIDDLVNAQEALRESERQLQQLIDALPTQIWAATAEGEPSYLNRRLAEYVGLTLGDLDAPDASRLQMAIQSSVHPDDAASVERALLHSFTTGDTFAMKYRQRRADGVYRWINGRAEPLRDPSGRIVQWYGVSFDIDEDVRTEEELRRTQERLAVASQAASLAELSASIAHEVNQPLAAIVANSHACHRWLSAEPPNVERAKITAERIIRDANAAADVVSRIRALFRQSVKTRASATLGSVISEARGLMAEDAARRRVRMDLEVESDLPLVAFDSVQLQQVLINLIRNGMDAMDSIAGDRVLGMRVSRMGDMVRTEISDCGEGVEFPEKIFEPFFTTKENGMGMGLAICRSIVESHGGKLWAEKNEPHGARFIFTLPVEVKAAA